MYMYEYVCKYMVLYMDTYVNIMIYTDMISLSRAIEGILGRKGTEDVYVYVRICM
jgi:hypothetical protein